MYKSLTIPQYIATLKSITDDRLQPYIDNVQKIFGTQGQKVTPEEREYALELYDWSVELAGLLQQRITYIEIPLRNAIDRELRAWNKVQTGTRLVDRYDTTLGREVPQETPINYTEHWTEEGKVGDLLYAVLPEDSLKIAFKSAKRASHKRPNGHPRKSKKVTHQDVLTKLSLGTWEAIIANQGDDRKRQQLWEEALYKAFSHAPNPKRPDTRRDIGYLIRNIQTLRNRIAHHDSILYEDINGRLNDIKTLANYIDPDIVQFIDDQKIYKFLQDTTPRRKFHAIAKERKASEEISS